MERLSGKVAVITGAASGIGFALSRRLGREGALIAAADVDAAALDAAVASLRSEGANAVGIVTDVGCAADVERLADETRSAFGPVDIVCNNAGTVSIGASWETAPEDWERVLRVNLWSVVHAIRVFIPEMIRRKEPAHLNSTSSMAGLLPMPSIAPYDASKAGVCAISEALYQELQTAGHTHVEVSVLCPGSVVTRMSRPATRPPTALSAETVADITVDGIRTGRFWILTQPLYHDRIRRHAEGKIAGTAPEVSENV
jgi:NAD(P)-dependent dehydrogenase (short-subunit alcohol dehydrogenase family)